MLSSLSSAGTVIRTSLGELGADESERAVGTLEAHESIRCGILDEFDTLDWLDDSVSDPL